MKVLLAVALVLLFAGLAFPQSTSTPLLTGFPELGRFDGTKIDTVSTINGNLHIQIPIATFKGRDGMDVSFSFYYDQRGFNDVETCPPPPAQTCQMHVKAETNQTIGMVFTNSANYYPLTYNMKGRAGCDGHGYFPAQNIVLREPDGTKHHFMPDYSLIPQSTCYPAGTISTLYADDGSGWMASVDPVTQIPHYLVGKNGTKITFSTTNQTNTTITNSNGNQLNEAGTAPNQIVTDTLGRTFNANLQYNSSTGNYEWYYFDSQGNKQTVVIKMTTVQIQTSECQYYPDDYPCYEYTGGVTTPSQITLPKSVSGSTASATYNIVYEQNSYGKPTSIQLPSGSVINWCWERSPWDGTPTGGAFVAQNRVISSQTITTQQCTQQSFPSGSSVWSYSYSTAPPSSKILTITQPDTDAQGRNYKTVHTAANRVSSNVSVTGGDPIPVQVDYLDGAGNPIKSETTEYDQTSVLLPIAETTIWPPSANGGLRIRKETTFDSASISGVIASWKNPVETREYDFYAGDANGGNNNKPAYPIRKTDYTYLHLQNSSYLNVNIADRETSKIVYQVNPSTGVSTRVAETDSLFDQLAVSSTSGVPGHDYTNFSSSNNIRGNVNYSKRWLNTDGSWPTTTNNYNDLGNVTSTVDPGNHTTTFNYADSWASVPYNCGVGTNTQAFLTQTSAPDTVNQQGSTVHHRSQTSYFACNSLKQSTRDENDILASRTGTSYSYDEDLRLLSTTYMDGGQTSFVYNDAQNAMSITSLKALDSTHNIQNAVFLDGLGRVSQTKLTDPADGDTTTETTYTPGGLVSTVTNPHRSATSPTDGITSYQYDGLSRKILEIPPDGTATSNNVQTAFGLQTSGSPLGLTTTVTDQAGHKRMTVSDVLGRLAEVMEPDPSTGSLINATLYQYDTLDNLLCAVQKGTDATQFTTCAAASSTWRPRSFVYDSLSRLQTATNPESGEISWTYDADSNVLTKSDARGITVNYSPSGSPIDALHRVTQKTYSNSDPSVSYYYDQTLYNGLTILNGVGHQTGMNDRTGMAAWTFDTEGRMKQETRTINISGLTPSAVTKNLTYAYNLDGSPQSVTYPSNHVVNYAYYPTGQQTYSAGRPVQAVDSGSAIDYVTSGHYAPHGEISSLTNGYTSSFAGIVTTKNWNDRFQPSSFVATPSGAGSVLSLTFNFNLGAQDNGLLLAITNQNSARSTTYNYDQLNRIANAYHTSATDWGTIYGEDIWGNLTSKSNCTTVCGGTARTGDPWPGNNTTLTVKNQLSNTVNAFTYDANGNMTADSFGYSYSYDAENRPYSAGGVTYYYDGEGERVAKSNGKLYFFGTGSAPVVETDVNGNYTAEYIFFGGKRVAMRKADGSVHYYFADQIGSANIVTNAMGTVEQDIEYHPYGEEHVYTDSLGQEYRFTGKEHDTETGNDYFGARYYSNALGRFMTPDWAATPVPIPYAQPAIPQTLNLYSYVENNPITGIDPDGHCPPCAEEEAPAAAESAPAVAEAAPAAAEAAPAAGGTSAAAGSSYFATVGGLAVGDLILAGTVAGEIYYTLKANRADREGRDQLFKQVGMENKKKLAQQENQQKGTTTTESHKETTEPEPKPDAAGGKGVRGGKKDRSGKGVAEQAQGVERHVEETNKSSKGQYNAGAEKSKQDLKNRNKQYQNLQDAVNDHKD